jgi:protein gp37
MAKDTRIAWCRHTFNTWWGCVEVSPGCDNCYARKLAERFGFAIWGKDAPRRFFGDQHWQEPRAWNRQAARQGQRRRVFCASMADVLEERTDAVGERQDAERERLWRLIEETPWLDWLFLTKRPQFYRRIPKPILALPNVWPGTTVESADYLWRADELVRLDCAGRRWVSYEPALGLVDFGDRLGPGRIEWIVFGGESGSEYRERLLDLVWLEAVAAQCTATGTALFVKQDSAYKDGQQGRILDALWARKEVPMATG